MTTLSVAARNSAQFTWSTRNHFWHSLATAILSYGAADALGSVVPMTNSGAPTALGVATGALYLFSYLVLAVGLARMLTAIRSR